MHCKYCGSEMQLYLPGFKFCTVLELDFGDYVCENCGAKNTWVRQEIVKGQFHYNEKWSLPTQPFSLPSK